MKGKGRGLGSQTSIRLLPIWSYYSLDTIPIRNTDVLHTNKGSDCLSSSLVLCDIVYRMKSQPLLLLGAFLRAGLGTFLSGLIFHNSKLNSVYISTA